MREEQTFTPQLIDKLDNILNTGGHLPLERRLIDTAIWFHRNKPRLARENVMGKIEFLEKTCDILIELGALLTERMQEAEGKKRHATLWLPKGLSKRGDVEHFG